MKKTILVLISVLLTGLTVSMTTGIVYAQQPEILKIDVCHATASDTNPYTKINVNINSVENAQTVSGHGDHENDIWAPYNYGGIDYPGQGDQSILENDCNVPQEEPLLQPLSLVGKCIELSAGNEFELRWTVSNPNDVDISFTWSANNGKNGTEVVPANGIVKFKTAAEGNKVTIAYILNEEQAEAASKVASCQAEETTIVPVVVVDPQPDQPAGGTGPSLISTLITPLLTGISGLGFTAGLISVIKKFRK